MDLRTDYSSKKNVPAVGINRRQMLKATGILGLASFSGCLSSVASATSKTRASPAAPFAGFGEYTGPSPTGDPTVYKLTPTVSSDSELLSGEVELEAWVTAQTIAATCCFDYNDGTSQNNPANYNNSRSNKSTSRGSGDADSDADGVSDTVESRTIALELENRLLSQTTEVASISKRSARTGRNPETNKPIKEYFGEMMGTIEEIQATLEGCSDDVCVTIRKHADDRWSLIQEAAKHVENSEWEAASENVRAIQEIVEGDIQLLESSLNDANVSEVNGEILLEEGRDMALMREGNGEDITALYEYLAGEPVISEQFTITVPDARVPGQDLALVDELTTRRLIEYVTGRADDDGKLYAWGRNKLGTETGGDNTSPIYEGEEVGGENVLNKGLMADDNSLYNSDTFLSAVSGPVDTGIHLESHVVDGRIIVRPINDPPQATETTPAVAVSADGSSSKPADFDEWGSESGESAATSTLVCPIMVAPPDCPMPFPALLYVSRCKHADQYIYTGGWVIDDGSLYEDSITLVDVGGPTEVIGVDAGDLDGDGYGDVMARRLMGDRERRGARLFDGWVSDAVAEGVLSEGKPTDRVVRKKPGRTTRQEEGTDDGVPVVIAQQGRIVHLTETKASDNVKFKAGAELSKSVN